MLAIVRPVALVALFLLLNIQIFVLNVFNLDISTSKQFSIEEVPVLIESIPFENHVCGVAALKNQIFVLLGESKSDKGFLLGYTDPSKEYCLKWCATCMGHRWTQERSLRE